MGKPERTYLRRLRAGLSELESAEKAPPSAEEAVRRFVRLMREVAPVFAAMGTRPTDHEADPDEAGLYQRWRDLAARRR